MSIEIFDGFAIEQIVRQTPNGQSITFWNIGKHFTGGEIKWSDDHSAQSRAEAISLGRRFFS